MHCNKARRLLSDYLDRRLDPDLRQALKHHLAACSSCREELEGLRRATNLLRGAGVPQPPPQFAAQIKRSVVERGRPDSVSPPPAWQALRAWKTRRASRVTSASLPAPTDSMAAPDPLRQACPTARSSKVVPRRRTRLNPTQSACSP